MGSCQGIKGAADSVSRSYCPPVSPPQHGAGALFPASPNVQPWVLTVPLARAAGAVCEQHPRAAPALPVPLRALRKNLHRLLPGQGSLLHLGRQDLRPTPAHREEVSVCPPQPCIPLRRDAVQSTERQVAALELYPPAKSLLPLCLLATHPFLIPLLEALPQGPHSLGWCSHSPLCSPTGVPAARTC